MLETSYKRICLFVRLSVGSNEGVLYLSQSLRKTKTGGNLFFHVRLMLQIWLGGRILSSHLTCPGTKKVRTNQPWHQKIDTGKDRSTTCMMCKAYFTRMRSCFLQPSVNYRRKSLLPQKSPKLIFKVTLRKFYL